MLATFSSSLVGDKDLGMTGDVPRCAATGEELSEEGDGEVGDDAPAGFRVRARSLKKSKRLTASVGGGRGRVGLSH